MNSSHDRATAATAFATITPTASPTQNSLEITFKETQLETELSGLEKLETARLLLGISALEIDVGEKT